MLTFRHVHICCFITYTTLCIWVQNLLNIFFIVFKIIFRLGCWKSFRFSQCFKLLCNCHTTKIRAINDWVTLQCLTTFTKLCHDLIENAFVTLFQIFFKFKYLITFFFKLITNIFCTYRLI